MKKFCKATGKNSPERSCSVSDLPYWLALAILGGVLIVREAQHQKLVRALIDKILIKQGSDPLPEEPPNFLETMVEKLTETRTPHNPELVGKKIAARQAATVHFQIPGMDVAKAMGRPKDSK